MEIKQLINYCDMQIKRYEDNIETLRLSANPTYDWNKHNIFIDKIQKYKDLKQICKKQIPQNPITLKYQPLIDYGWEHSCPTCNCAAGINSHGYDFTQEDNYCPNCGQKLDWGR